MSLKNTLRKANRVVQSGDKKRAPGVLREIEAQIARIEAELASREAREAKNRLPAYPRRTYSLEGYEEQLLQRSQSFSYVT